VQKLARPARLAAPTPDDPSMTDEMCPQGTKRKARLARVAAGQWGNVTTAQLRALGFSPKEVHGMAARRELHRRHQGVYAYGAMLPAPEAKWAAGLLAAGPGAALSHTAGVALRGLMAPRYVTEVTAPTQRRGDEALRIHVARLGGGDTELVKGLRTTTVPRMLLELAATGWPIARLTHEAAASGLSSLAEIRAYADAHNHRRGATALRAAANRPHTRSRGEERLHAFLTRKGIPHEMNHTIGAINVDAFIPDLNVAVELDHPETHGSAHAAATDAWRDAYVRARGIDPLRIDANDFAVLAAELRRRAGYSSGASSAAASSTGASSAGASAEASSSLPS
jgi:very-short-patch-repair endonuclease